MQGDGAQFGVAQRVFKQVANALCQALRVNDQLGSLQLKISPEGQAPGLGPGFK